jgi:hypothetical protein
VGLDVTISPKLQNQSDANVTLEDAVVAKNPFAPTTLDLGSPNHSTPASNFKTNLYPVLLPISCRLWRILYRPSKRPKSASSDPELSVETHLAAEKLPNACIR